MTKYTRIASVLAAIGFIAFIYNLGGDNRENANKAKYADILIKAVEEAKQETARLNNDLGKIQNAKNKAIAEKPINTSTNCINPDILGLLDQIADSVPDNP